jgi:hypothetical protein
MTTSISARFNGADRTFCIHRDDLPYFEARFGSAFHLYKKLTSGPWTASDLLGILRFASGPRPRRDCGVEMYQMNSVLNDMLASNPSQSRPPCPIEDAFAANGPAIYALLAQKVLAAALFQLMPDEKAFTDEVAEDGV